RNCDALALSAGKLDPSLPNDRVITIRELDNELVSVGRACRRFNLFTGRAKLTVSDVLPNRSAEQGSLLRHHSDCASQFGESHRSDVATLHENRSRCHIIEAR